MGAPRAPYDRIANRFDVERRIGAGGAATIYRARDLETGEFVAIKVMRRSSDEADEQDLARFEREARSLAELRHPAIVRYVAHGKTDDGEPYLVMEWLDGEDLNARLSRGLLSIADSVALARRVAEALAIVHAQSLVHRDIKPANLFLVGGSVDDVKLIDFGVARWELATVSLTRTGAMIGTPGFMAPEQARGQRDIDARADLFSLGCVLFRCLTGRPPFPGEHLWAMLTKVLLEETPRAAELRPDVPVALDALIVRMMSKRPADRPGDASVIAAELAKIEMLPETTAPSVAPPEGLTVDEQRVTAMLLVGRDRSAVPVDGSDEARLQRAASPSDPDEDELDALARRHGGQLDRLVDGTAVVTFTGSAVATDLAARAARCALAIRVYDPSVPIALAMVRSEAGARRPLGDAIDRAARMLWRRMDPGEAPPERGLDERMPIAIDEVTAGLLDARFDVLPMDGGFDLRGAGDVPLATRMLLGKPTAYVGREWELSALQQLLKECIDEPVARAAIVIGTPGMGKSRLAQELVAAARRACPDIEIWLGRGDALRAGSALGLLGEALRRACGIQGGEPLETRQRKIAERAARHLSDEKGRRVAEFLGELIGAPFPAAESAPLRAARADARIMSEQLRRAWEDFLEAESSACPVLLVLDDLQWGDLSTVRFIDTTLKCLRQLPWMVVALARPEVHDVFPRVWEERDVQEIRLAPLSRRASERLVRHALGSEVSAELPARLASQADGNAFYLEELIRAVAATEPDVEASRLVLPETVLAMVQARLDGLDAEGRRVLRAASVFGDVFWPSAVATLLGTSADGALAKRLGDLVARELIAAQPESRFAGERELAFRHALLREGAYAMLTEADRELGHRLAAEWLERHGEANAMLLAQHFERGRDQSRAVSAYARAAEQSLRGDDHEAAIARAERGVACGASGEELGCLRLIQAEAHGWRSEYKLAEQRGAEATNLLVPGSAAWFRAMTEVVFAESRLLDTERVAIWVERVWPTAPLPGALGAKIVCVSACAIWMIFGGRYAAADVLLRVLDELWRELPDIEPPVAAALLQARAYRINTLGDLSACVDTLEAALAAFEEADDRRNALRTRGDIGYIKMRLGDFDEAERSLSSTVATAERMGLPSIRAIAQHNLGLVLAYLGRIEQGRALLHQALEAFTLQRDPRHVGIASCYLAEISLLAGDFTAAEREARRALTHLSAVPPLCPMALATLASALLSQGGRVDEALEAASDAHHRLEALRDVEDGEARVRLTYAEALRAAGREDDFARAMSDARAHLLASAGRLSCPDRRSRFLSAIPENARTLSLAAAVDAAAARDQA